MGLSGPRVGTISNASHAAVLGDGTAEPLISGKSSAGVVSRVEFEIALRLGRDLDPAAAPFSEAIMRDAVDGVCAAMELVDDRNADYANLDAISLVADNSWNAGAVLGDFVETIDDLADLCGTVRLNGVEIDRGYGRCARASACAPDLARQSFGRLGPGASCGRCRADWQCRANAFPASRRHVQL